MNSKINKPKIMLFLFAGSVLYLFCSLSLQTQQMSDPRFDASVKNPAYDKGKGPVVLFDEGHHNFHTSKGRYKPFADVITNDGYVIAVNNSKFNKDVLKGHKILIISNALNKKNEKVWQSPYYPAFTDDEIEAVHHWVKQGGALLLIADHEPFGTAAYDLAKKFGVLLSKWTAYDLETDPKIFRISFTREKGTLIDHPITLGRNKCEIVDKVRTFGGEALQAPEGSGFLKFTDNAFIVFDKVIHGDQLDKAKKALIPGQFQGAAFGYGKGRVVVLGEAAMLTAQISKLGFSRKKGKEVMPLQKKRGMGMYPHDNDNKQFLLNLMHYLSGLLKVGITVSVESSL